MYAVIYIPDAMWPPKDNGSGFSSQEFTIHAQELRQPLHPDDRPARRHLKSRPTLALPFKDAPMKQFFLRLLATLTFTVAASCAMAQEGTSADELIQTALTGLRQIDENRSGELWDVTSAFVRTKLPREEFVSGVQRARQTVGSVTRRDWASVVRIRYQDDSSVPNGLYANVDFATRLSDGKTVYEMVSLRLEPSGWKLTGYVPREKQ